TKILPHNFIELIDASIKHLQGKRFKLYPDFPTAGIIDISNYNDGMRGGKVRVRARISQLNKNTLIITEIPFSTTTSSLIDSILKANDKGKIKIKRIEDNTAAEVEILIHLPSGISPEKTIDALYAFTKCENSISPLGCVIEDHKPLFINVSEILRRSTDNTVELLKRELEIKLNEYEEQWHFASLERIFIENRIYRDIEEEETWEGVISAIDKGLKPFTKHLKRAVTEDDIVRLTEIRIKRISKFDIDKAQQKIDALEENIAEVKYHLENLIDHAIGYFNRLKTDYGKGKERKTEIRVFDDVDAKRVVIRNTKLYVNREEGFVGTSMRKDEYVCDCSDIDDIIVFTKSAKMMVTKVDSKTFVGKDIIHVAVFKKKDSRTIYNMIYRDGSRGHSFIKRFAVTGVTRDKEYDLARGNKGSTVWYFTANPNGEAETVTVLLRQKGGLKKLKWDLDFADILVKGRGVKGKLVTKNSIKRIELKYKGVSTLKPRKIWFDDTVSRLNVDGRGDLIGEFRGEDRLLIIKQSGLIKTIIPEMTARFDDDMIVLEKWVPKKPISAIYYDGEKERYFVKRFLVENENREEVFISAHKDSQLEIISTDWRPMAEIVFAKKRGKDRKENMEINLEEFITVKGISAQGNQLTRDKVNQINLLDPLPFDPPEEVPADEIEVVDEEIVKDENLKPGEAKPSTNGQPDDELPTDDEGQITLF
ncbi:MAG: DNA gyrase/topoisomerase IV subunit A, partial [Bacteroidia bacterium]|nr:DNA gyrase/topoisomerase IV subunit A [Bacteroidia bacterium]